MMIDGGSDWRLTISPSKTRQTMVLVARIFGLAGCLPSRGRVRGERIWNTAVGVERRDGERE